MTEDEVRLCLGHLLGREVLTLARRRSRYSTSFPIEKLDVGLADGSTLALVRKDLSRGALLPEAVGAKPEFLHDPLREIEVYRSALADADLGTAVFHGAWVKPERDQYWLFIERVDGVELWQEGDFDVWLGVARWLARFHQSSLAVDAQLRDRLVVYDRDFYRVWARRAQAFHGNAEPVRRRRLAWVLRHHDEVVDRLLELDTGFIHGELYASNVLIRVTGRLRVCPIDWEVAAIGPSLFDLAALVSGRWTSEERLTLVAAYERAVRQITTTPSDRQGLLAALDLCRLHLCVRWLGWAPGWSPPPEHAQDWLGQAVEIGEAIGW